MPPVLLRFRFDEVWVEVEQGQATCDNRDRRFVALARNYEIWVQMLDRFL